MQEKIKSLAQLNDELRALVTEIKLGQVSTTQGLDLMITTATELVVRQERLLNGMKVALKNLSKRDPSTTKSILLLLGKDISKEALQQSEE